MYMTLVRSLVRKISLFLGIFYPILRYFFWLFSFYLPSYFGLIFVFKMFFFIILYTIFHQYFYGFQNFIRFSLYSKNSSKWEAFQWVFWPWKLKMSIIVKNGQSEMQKKNKIFWKFAHFYFLNQPKKMIKYTENIPWVAY